jgi:predicted ATPase
MSLATTTRLVPLEITAPRAQTGFVGRDGEIAEGVLCLGSARLLTLTGSGGCGKTRLAIQLANTIGGQYPDGVWLVELAAISDPRLVPQTVAAVLGVREQPGRSLLDTLSTTLRSRRLLVVLDNCEHVIEAAAPLAKALLSSCPNLRILATSREALRIPGEISRRVPSLSLPGPGRRGSDAMKSEAVRLFVDRAKALVPAFALNAGNTDAVAQICIRLDGIPLAIELAASRVKLLTPGEIASRLDDSFRLLTGGPGRALPRHQTLQALIDWSYDLLSDTERLLLRRLSVFAGGWSVEAAEAVCVDDPGSRARPGIAIAREDILDLMTALMEKSLVIVEDEASMRCRFLETVRQYAGRKLEESGEAAALRDRHGDHFITVAEQGRKGDLAERLKSLEREHDNFRAALDWSCKADGRAQVGLKIAESIGSFWSIRGYFSEGRTYLTQLLERGAAAPAELRSRALRWVGNMAWLEGRFEESERGYGSALALSEEAGDKVGIAIALCGLGNVARHRRDYDRARDALEKSLAIYRELEDRDGIAALLNNLGALASNENQIDRAIALYREALAISRDMGDKWGIASRLGNLAEVTMYHGETDEAAAMHRESLALWVEIGDPRSIAEGLEMFVETLCAQGRMDLAARLLGAVESLREAIGAPRPPVDQGTIQKALDSARSALGAQRFDKAWAEGLAMGPEEAVARAIEEAEA